MKKRSNPIPLLSVAVLLIGVIGFLNFRNMPVAPDQKQDAQQPVATGAPNAMGPKRSAPSKDELKSKVDVGGSSPTPGGPKGMPPAPPSMGGPPGMPGKFPKPPKAGYKPPKPMPNDSQISTQWYTDETNKTAGH